MNKHDNRQRGMSLAEVLVALAIFAIIFLAALTAYDRSNRMFKTGVESSNLQQNTRVAFDKLVADVRMAGYDFDRDGIPTGSVGGVNIYQQPDEQFEYIGPAAITIRGNFDYETENQPCAGAVTDNCDNGRELTYESTSFPVVTTGNDEIVTYALVPDSQTPGPPFPACDPNTNCIQLYADTNIPRQSYPDPGHPACPACTPPITALAAGLDENVVEIPGVDLCAGGCNKPPYTLYRFTLDRSQTNFTAGANVIRTPLASNIRSMTFTYYQDAQGSDPLKDLPNTTDVSTGATIQGIGQYKVANPTALIPERGIRAKINSVRVTLIGMNESRDAAFTDTAETVTGGPGYFEQYRKYRLETLVSPRNIQKRGMREQDTYPPGAPTILNVCTGACGGVYIDWSAPAVSAIQGAPDQYKVIYDTAASAGYNCETTTFTNTFTHVFGTTPLCKLTANGPNVPYKFAVVALNSYGSATSASVTVTPVNTTKPGTPTMLTATTNLNGKVTLTWKRPTANNPPGGYSCGPATPNPAELQGYLVQRALAPAGPYTPLLPGGGSVTTSSPYDTVSFTDTTVVNCIDYYYQVTAVEFCASNAAFNSPAVASTGLSNPTAAQIGRGSNVVGGTPLAPKQPVLNVDQKSPCVANVCNVQMTITPPTLDTANNPINVNTYDVQRKVHGTATWSTIATLTNPTLNVNNQIDYTDNGLVVPLVPPGTSFDYQVIAYQCSLPSVPSVLRTYPCAFATGATLTPLLSVSAFDGDGSSANPYKIASGTSAVATVNIADGSLINRVVGREYLGPGQQWSAQCPIAPFCSSPTYPMTPPLPPYPGMNATFAWQLAPGQTERLDVTVVDNSAFQCAEQTFAYFQDEPQNCCLLPKSATTVFSQAPPTDFVDIFFKSICGQALTINSVVLTWTPPPGQKMDAVLFPVVAGATPTLSFSFAATTSSPITAIPPIGTATIPAGSTNYFIRVHFKQQIKNSNVFINGVAVNYSTSGTPQPACTIAP